MGQPAMLASMQSSMMANMQASMMAGMQTPMLAGTLPHVPSCTDLASPPSGVQPPMMTDLPTVRPVMMCALGMPGAMSGTDQSGMGTPMQAPSGVSPSTYGPVPLTSNTNNPLR